jgi:urea transport system permease protein
VLLGVVGLCSLSFHTLANGPTAALDTLSILVYVLVAVVLLLIFALARQLTQSRYGELLVAVRDQENRVRFLGYDPANVKLVAYVVAAGMAGLAGALFVPVVGIISPALIGVVPSIEFVIGVAVGGRASLLGPVLGAVAVAWARTSLSEDFPQYWTYLQGALFVVAVAFLPGGLASLVPVVRRWFHRDRPGPTAPPRSGEDAPEDPEIAQDRPAGSAAEVAT